MGSPVFAARFNRPGLLNGAAEQQQLFGQVVLPASGCEIIANVFLLLTVFSGIVFLCKITLARYIRKRG